MRTTVLEKGLQVSKKTITALVNTQKNKTPPKFHCNFLPCKTHPAQQKAGSLAQKSLCGCWQLHRRPSGPGGTTVSNTAQHYHANQALFWAPGVLSRHHTPAATKKPLFFLPGENGPSCLRAVLAGSRPFTPPTPSPTWTHCAWLDPAQGPFPLPRHHTPSSWPPKHPGCMAEHSSEPC